jgi:hypothetical protein
MTRGYPFAPRVCHSFVVTLDADRGRCTLSPGRIDSEHRLDIAVGERA